MRKLLVMLAFASVVVSSNASAQEAGTVTPPMPPAPIGHVQPRQEVLSLISQPIKSNSNGFLRSMRSSASWTRCSIRN